MSFIKKSASAFGKLIIVIVLAAAFLVGMGGVVYMSLQGEEMKVPEIVGKDVGESEKELAALGLKLKKRADRFSKEKPNTILEQLPKAGETVKTGQMILVVTSKLNPDGEEEPATIKKNTDEDDSEKIEELISDKPKKTTNKNTNTNAKKKSATTRDVLSNKSNSNSADNSNSNKSSETNNNSTDKGNKNSSTNQTDTNKSKKPNESAKPSKTPSSGDMRPRKTPQP